MRQGIGVLDVLWGSAMPPGGEIRGDSGASAEVAFVAAPGTRIRSASVNRVLGHRFDEWTTYASIDGVDQAQEGCRPHIDEILCSRSGDVSFSGLRATALAFGARCSTSWPECSVGATLHEVWALVLEARVTVEDYEAPAVGVVEGLGSGWQRGALSLVFDASDNTGVMERRVVEGAAVRGTLEAPGASMGGCFGGSGVAYTYTQPCAGERGVNGRRAVTVNGCSMGDGVHQLRGVAVDTDRNESVTALVSVKVDCGAPAVVLDVGATTRLAGEALDPLVVATDAASGVAQRTVEVSASGGAWAPVTQSVPVVAGRGYRFRARATDVAGNVSAWLYSPVVAGVAAPQVDRPIPIPAPPPAGLAEAPTTAIAKTEERADVPAPPGEQIVRAAPPQTATTTATTPPAQQPRRDPRLRITTARRDGRVLTIGGTVAKDYKGRVTIVAGGRRKRATARHGRWRLTIRTTAGHVTVQTAQRDGFAAASTTRSTSTPS